MNTQELIRAINLANKLLDAPYVDPDDDLRVLSRQLLRSQERLENLSTSLIEKLEGDTKRSAPFLTVEENIAWLEGLNHAILLIKQSLKGE